MTDKDNVLNQKQFYLNEFTPKYNILKQAWNSKSYVHTVESIAKIKVKSLGKKHTIEVKTKMNQTRMGKKQ